MAKFERRNAAYNLHDLEENLELLDRKWGNLLKSKQALKARIDEAERPREILKRDEVKDWLHKVHILEQVIEDIQFAQNFRNKCLNCCPNYCVPSKKLRKNIVNTLNDVDELMAAGKNLYKDDNAAYRNALLNRVWHSIEDENVGTIGLYGMGGAGKTTILKRICKEFERRKNDFDVVISVTVSRDLNKNRIMDKIRRVLNIGHDVWNNIRETAAEIHQVLRRKRFALLLDDVWEPLDLEMLGVPSSTSTNNQSKVVFTTRFEDVCIKMQAQKFEVECLSNKDAFELFCIQVGEKTLNINQNIRQLAREMATECKGLPLALVTVGRSMAEVKNVDEWKDSIRELRSSAQVSSDSEKNMSVVKFSYDKLPDELHKMCFLYCALYPSEYEIKVDNLIDRWFGEGFLGTDKALNIHDMYAQGKTIIERLKLLCLLESVEEDIYKTQPMVKMHDVIRDMALWLLRDQDRNKNKVLVQKEVLEASKSDVETWNGAERISIMEIEGDWHVLPCPNLLTLCVSREVHVTNFFNLQSMRKLKVLDLSNFEGKLEILMEIGELINLEFLNLSKTRIEKRMAIELKKLKNLRVFLMELVCFDLEIIPLEVIASLERLKVFRFFRIETPKDKCFREDSEEKAFLEKLESLPYMEELVIDLQSIVGMEKLLQSTKLQCCLRKMMLYGINGSIRMPSLLANLSKMKNLELIRLSGLHQLMEDSSIFTNSHHLLKLQWVIIEDCNSLLHLTWLKFAPFLEVLWVNNCEKIEELVKGYDSEDQAHIQDVDDMFLTLKRLYLFSLPKLKSIHKKTLSFPSLKFIHITDCPNLKKLPFSANSASNSLMVIQGCPQWWNSLEWEEPAIKEAFQSKFRCDSDYPNLSIYNFSHVIF